MFREFHYQVRGRGHVLDGSRGQDRTAYLSRGGVQVLCLSDGAGSASHSEYGAQALVEAGCHLLSEHFREFVTSDDGAALKIEVARGLLDRVRQVAQRLGVPTRDLAATFLAVAVADGQFLAFHVGDGVIGYIKDGTTRVLSEPDNSEFANQTVFMTSESVVVSMRVLRGRLEGVAGFILMSDGTASSLYNSRARELAPACAKIVALLASAPSRQSRNPDYKKQLRRLIDTRVRFATKDDCSIGVLARRPA